MKKLQTLILCTAVLSVWVLLVNAKELTNIKANANPDSITDIYNQAKTDNQNWITAWDENSVWRPVCEVDKDLSTKDYTQLLIDNCLLTEKRDIKICDKDWDWKVNIADITYFIDLCVLWAPVAEDLPTYESSSNNNKKDLLSGAKIAKTWYINKTLIKLFMI